MVVGLVVVRLVVGVVAVVAAPRGQRRRACRAAAALAVSRALLERGVHLFLGAIGLGAVGSSRRAAVNAWLERTQRARERGVSWVCVEEVGWVLFSLATRARLKLCSRGAGGDERARANDPRMPQSGGGARELCKMSFCWCLRAPCGEGKRSAGRRARAPVVRKESRR